MVSVGSARGTGGGGGGGIRSHGGGGNECGLKLYRKLFLLGELFLDWGSNPNSLK